MKKLLVGVLILIASLEVVGLVLGNWETVEIKASCDNGAGSEGVVPFSIEYYKRPWISNNDTEKNICHVYINGHSFIGGKTYCFISDKEINVVAYENFGTPHSVQWIAEFSIISQKLKYYNVGPQSKSEIYTGICKKA